MACLGHFKSEREVDEFIYNTAKYDMKMCDASLNQLMKKLHYLPQVKKTSYMITIALPNDYPLGELVDKLKKLKKYSYMEQYFFSIDNFSKSGENLHTHILTEGKLCKPKVILDFSRHFKIEGNFVDVRRKTTKLQYDNALDYIKGNKTDATKVASVVLDDKWREDNNLEKYYEL